MNINHYVIYYTVIKNRHEIENMNDDDYENDYIDYEDIITPNHYIGIKPCETNVR